MLTQQSRSVMFQKIAQRPLLSALVIGLGSVSLSVFAFRRVSNGVSNMAAAPDPDADPAKAPAPGTFSFSFVTAPDEDVAKKIARGLVSNKLAACVNIVPKVVSVYEWQGKIEEDAEVMMIVKSRSSRLEEVTRFVRENHPYDVVEVISSQITQGNEPYLKWLGEVVPEKAGGK